MTVPDPLDLAVARRAWRVLFAVYAIALTIGTHWPRLQLGTEAIPAPDKLIHLVAFGTLAFLLWRTGWLPRLGLFAAVVLVWPVIDEASQALPILGRTVTWVDLVAGQLGASIVIAARWAMRPVGGPASRARLRLLDAALEGVFARPRGWLIAAGGGLAGAIAGGAIMFARGGLSSPGSILLGAVGGGLIASHTALEGLRRRALDEAIETRMCPLCGRSAGSGAPDEHGDCVCRSCGAALWAGTWSPRLDLPRPSLLRLVVAPALLVVAMIGAVTLLYLAAVLLHGHLPWTGDLTRAYHRLPEDFRLNLDLTLIAFVLLGAVRLFRRRIAALYDAQHERCLGCGHDVHASPRVGTTGRCSECGRVFHVPPP